MPKIKPKQAQTIGVFSCKGGVGKTTTVANLGVALSESLEGDVLLVDANLTASNLSIHFGELDPSPTIHDVLAEEKSIDEVTQDVDGVDAIYGSMAFGEEIHRVDLKGCLDPLKKKYKLILLDTSPGLGSEVISSIKDCDEMLILTNPDTPTVASTLKTFRAAERYKVSIWGTVVNKVLGQDYELSPKDIKKALGWPIVANVPDDDRVRESTAEGIPIVKFELESEAAKEFVELAEKLEEHIKSG
ncbi:hypothetical protein AKJ47_00065 [candidate division MSBL1 archaeon SCGC-AAA261G05]|uniref:CobQ/CobB/MinD/ParA nucleotide binding domain-containing protein n=3 Tax=candidate division MSBL1 TaxID=215777 RepID=A0A133UZD3_9EURY|nr:hypothetical protein AKJ42_02970 [candidate division MSBL1 archaeon SCGC-AAA261C02]KXB04239.1 hypothetical protein AKJ47_00065 [candidate division MSBL1 archaeon SCGC-AAA261G05]KXB05103.1 hypothetical protein AKJ48_00090 [candidate division MSBL1 archaeon SCGC-AAA261O19]